MKNRVLLFLGAIALGGIPLFVKLVGESMHVMSLSFFRLFFAFLFLLLIVPFLDKDTFSVKKKHIAMYALVGFLFAVALTMFNSASLFLPIQNAVLINSSAPLFVLIFAYFLLQERITKHKIITVAISFVGLAIINPFQKGDFLLGSLLALGSALVYGLLITLMRKEDKCETIGAVVWFFFFASLFTLPFPFIFGIGSTTQIGWLYVLGLGVISTGVAYLLINIALEKIEAEEVALYTMIILPLVAITGSVFLFQENLNLRVIVGGLILIVAGVYMQLKCYLLEEENLPLLHAYK